LHNKAAVHQGSAFAVHHKRAIFIGNDCVINFIEDVITKQRLLYGRCLEYKVKLRYDKRRNYIYFYEGEQYFMHYELPSFYEWITREVVI